jgi:hypothetical protein
MKQAHNSSSMTKVRSDIIINGICFPKSNDSAKIILRTIFYEGSFSTMLFVRQSTNEFHRHEYQLILFSTFCI